jgi:hypothetical protein
MSERDLYPAIVVGSVVKYTIKEFYLIRRFVVAMGYFLLMILPERKNEAGIH